jgi:hypothetical protein
MSNVTTSADIDTFMQAADAADAATALGLGAGDAVTFAAGSRFGAYIFVNQIFDLGNANAFVTLSDGTKGVQFFGRGSGVAGTFSDGCAVFINTTTPTAPSEAANIMALSGVLSGQNDGESAASPIARLIQSTNTLLAQTSDVNPIVSLTVGSDGPYLLKIEVFYNQVTAGGGGFNIEANITDENGSNWNINLAGSQNGVVPISFVGTTTGPIVLFSTTVLVQAGSTTTVFTNGASGTFDVAATIYQLI